MNALKLIEQHLKGQPLKPPLHLWNPDLSGVIDIIIRSNGDWIHEGSKIQRLPLVKLFASIMRREDDQHFYLVTPVEKWQIQVEEAPLQIIDMDILNRGGDKQQIVFTSNVDDKILLGKDHILSVAHKAVTQEPIPTIDLDNNLFAKINRPVFYRLVDRAVEKDHKLCILSDGCWFELGELE
ncbi:MAG: DUF1285 domain-containing protein [Pseudomonadales bacterium]